MKADVNPRTNRKIKVGGPVYRELEFECNLTAEKCKEFKKNKNINPLTKKKIVNEKQVEKFEKACLDKVVGRRETLQQKVFKAKSPPKKPRVMKAKSPSKLPRVMKAKSPPKKPRVMKAKSPSKLPSIPLKRKKIIKKTSPEEIKESDILWHGMPEFKLKELSPCMRNIIIDKYLSRGAFGSVYRVKYKSKKCAMKIVFLDNVAPNSSLVSCKDFITEVSTLQKVSDLGVGPKIYEFNACYVKMENPFGNKILTIGFVIMELFKETISDYIEKVAKKIAKTSDKKLYYDNVKFLKYVEQKILKDNNLAARQIGAFNIDIHAGNIMLNFDDEPFITDWGFTASYSRFISLDLVKLLDAAIEEERELSD
jgi:hypothetical protein